MMNMTPEVWAAIVDATKAGVANLNTRAEAVNAARVNSYDAKYLYEVSEHTDDLNSVLMVINECDRRDNRGIARSLKTGKVYRVKYIRRGGGRRELEWNEPLKRWSKLEGKTADEIAEGVGLFKVWMPDIARTA
jgi:hypothetical protein